MGRQMMHYYHRQVGIFATLWLVLAALTTLALNHRDLWLASPAAEVGKGVPFEHYLLCHTISPHDPAQVMVGTDDGVFVSADGGKSFRQVALPVPAHQVAGVAYHPIRVDQLYVALREGLIYSSLDGGKQWDRVIFPGTAPIQSFYVSRDGSLTVLSPEGLYTRTEETWGLTPRPSGESSQERSRRWLRWVYAAHDGQIWGRAAVFVTDCLAVAILFLVASGMWLAAGELSLRTRKAPPVSEAAPLKPTEAASDPGNRADAGEPADVAETLV